MAGDNGMVTGWGVWLQLAILIGAIGIAWGSLSAKQSALDANLMVDRQQSTVMLLKLADIQDRLTRLEVTVNRKKGE